jgi:torulene dioxygenase
MSFSDVVDKVKGGVVAKYTADAFFAFHEVNRIYNLQTQLHSLTNNDQVNSFEDKDGSIVIDLPTMKDYTFLEAARIKNLRTYVGHHNATAPHDLAGTFTRYRLHNYAHGIQSNGALITHPATVDYKLDFKSGNIELPRINQAYHGKPYRYA